MPVLEPDPDPNYFEVDLAGWVRRHNPGMRLTDLDPVVRTAYCDGAAEYYVNWFRRRVKTARGDVPASDLADWLHQNQNTIRGHLTPKRGVPFELLFGTEVWFRELAPWSPFAPEAFEAARAAGLKTAVCATRSAVRGETVELTEADFWQLHAMFETSGWLGTEREERFRNDVAWLSTEAAKEYGKILQVTDPGGAVASSLPYADLERMCSAWGECWLIVWFSLARDDGPDLEPPGGKDVT